MVKSETTEEGGSINKQNMIILLPLSWDTTLDETRDKEEVKYEERT